MHTANVLFGVNGFHHSFPTFFYLSCLARLVTIAFPYDVYSYWVSCPTNVYYYSFNLGTESTAMDHKCPCMEKKSISSSQLTNFKKVCVSDSTRRSTFSAATIEVLDADDNESIVRAQATAAVVCQNAKCNIFSQLRYVT